MMNQSLNAVTLLASKSTSIAKIGSYKKPKIEKQSSTLHLPTDSYLAATMKHQECLETERRFHMHPFDLIKYGSDFVTKKLRLTLNED